MRNSIKKPPIHTRRYYKTERKIFQTVFRIVSKSRSFINLTIRGLCLCAHINASTFYRHFKSIADFNHHYESTYLADLIGFIDDLPGNPKSPQQTFERACIFLYRHRKTIQLSLYLRNTYLLEETLRLLRPVITRHWNNYGATINSYIYEIFSACAIKIIVIWCWQDGFDPHKINTLSRQLAHLSKISGPILAAVAKIC
jgi:hypothetical protein